MKKDILAISLLLLLLCATLLNTMYLDTLVKELVAEVDTSQEHMEKGDYVTAESKLRGAIDYWNSVERYICVVIRHSEIDVTADAFYGLLSDVVSQDAESAVGSYEKIRSHLLGIATMEYVTIGSIF